jgi:ribosomal protein S6--L-glutamate ligase
LRRSPIVIKDNKSLFNQYNSLQADDIICCRIRLKPGEEHLLLTLSERGVKVIPSLTSQLCSRSKAFQTRLFSWAMLPGTSVIYSAHDLLKAIGHYDNSGVTKVVLKQEGKNGGLGVFLFNSIEDIYTQSATGIHSYPFVIQPFFSNFRDLRVIVLDDYLEVYERIRSGGFRHNLHCGGSPRPAKLSSQQLHLCHKIMAQGAFPYAHLDLMVADDGTTYFTEINLRGGLRGAKIDSAAYRAKIDNIHANLCCKALEK